MNLIVAYIHVYYLVISVYFNTLCCFIFLLLDEDFLQHIEEKKSTCEYHNGLFMFCEYFTNLGSTKGNGQNLSTTK